MKKKLLLIGLIVAAISSQAFAADWPGFGKDIVVRVGDLNADGRQDIYLQQKTKIVPIMLDDLTIPIPLRPQVGEFVLQQNSAGEFSLISNLTNAAKQAVKTWAINSAIKVITRDLNIDGAIDVLLGKVGASIPGGKNVIIFASPGNYAPPSVVKNVDATLDQFITDVGSFSDNPNYFQSGVYRNCWIVYLRTLHYDPFTLEYYYSNDPYVYCEYVFDPSGFSIPAINFLRKFVPVANSGGIVAQTEAAVSISQQLRNLFGIEFFRGMLEHGGYMNTPCENLPYPQSEDCIQPIRLGGLVKILRDLVTGAQDAPKCSHGVAHHYSLQRSMCTLNSSFKPWCSRQNVYHEQLTHPVLGYLLNDTPIHEGQKGIAQIGVPMFTFDDAGPIVFHVKKPEFWHENHTLPGHDFHEGWVERQTVVVGGDVTITTLGGGTGDCKTFNEIVGISVFKALDVYIWNHVDGQGFVNHDPIP